jgi:hypothetical protein
VFVSQSLKDPLGRVALFLATCLVFFQDLIDGSNPGVQLGPARGLLPLAASRSLILSTTTARRTRA